MICHLMKDQNCEVALGKFTGDYTGNVYLSVSMSNHFEFPTVANGAPDCAFAPFGDNGAGMLYTKVSDSYGLTLSGWSNPQPQWITEWLNGKTDPIIINLQIQSNTPVVQCPTVTAEPAFNDWYYDDNSVG